MATIAVGDIHGNVRALDSLLARLISELNVGDTLVFLGDYIDRGPDSRACIERLVQLKEEGCFSTVTLIGNHEEWMLKTMSDYCSHSWILGMEAFETVASYSPEAARALRTELEDAGIRLITEKVRIRYDIFFDLLPDTHLRFFQNLVPYYRAPEVVCVHGGVDPDRGPVELQDPHVLTWGVNEFPEKYRGADSIVYGHWNNIVYGEGGWPMADIRENRTFGLDTISSGVLTAMRFPDLKVFQSDRFEVSKMQR
jgi:serine/threonine protein phosphatase 1